MDTMRWSKKTVASNSTKDFTQFYIEKVQVRYKLTTSHMLVISSFNLNTSVRKGKKEKEKRIKEFIIYMNQIDA